VYARPVRFLRNGPRLSVIFACASGLLHCTEDTRVVGRAALDASQGGSASGAPQSAGVGGTPDQGEAGASDPPLAPFGAPQLIAELSDPDADDTEPTLTPDELEIYFASTRVEGRKQIFVASRQHLRERWGPARLVEELAAASGDTYSPEISRDGLQLWFSSTRPGGSGGGDMYYANRPLRSAAWSPPRNVTELSSAACEIDPGPLPEHNQLVLTRCNDIGYNHLHLTRRAAADAAWDVPEYLPQLNTDQKEGDPAFAGGGLVLYFATTRTSPTLDDRADIWRATRPALNAPFGPPSAVSELNILEFDDQDPWVSDDERHVVFTSARGGGARDFYEAFR
jgi:hypothetical protein